jgi:multidrug transporter EmrE-like cation transporter
MLTASQIVQLTGFSLLLSAGQMLFKKAAQLPAPLASIPGMTALLANLWFWLALTLYGVATLLWIMILQKVPLSQAYPFAALGFVIIPLASWLLFAERLSAQYCIGIALIIAGILVVASAGVPSHG